MESKYQPSFLSPDGSKPDSSVVTLVRQAEADAVFHTQEQKDRALELIKAGKAANIDDAYQIMLNEDMSNPANDAHTLRE